MKSLAPALAALFLLSGPALAGGVFDLPRLSWPEENPAPVTQGCADQTAPGAATVCTLGQ
ncbi:MAG TPA: hypothetical protein VGA75_00455 [Paracoccaceae bacterium]